MLVEKKGLVLLNSMCHCVGKWLGLSSKLLPMLSFCMSSLVLCHLCHTMFLSSLCGEVDHTQAFVKFHIVNEAAQCFLSIYLLSDMVRKQLSHLPGK
jgi:hypothetical protein